MSGSVWSFLGVLVVAYAWIRRTLDAVTGTALVGFGARLATAGR